MRGSSIFINDLEGSPPGLGTIVNLAMEALGENSPWPSGRIDFDLSTGDTLAIIAAIVVRATIVGFKTASDCWGNGNLDGSDVITRAGGVKTSCPARTNQQQESYQLTEFLLLSQFLEVLISNDQVMKQKSVFQRVERKLLDPCLELKSHSMILVLS